MRTISEDKTLQARDPGLDMVRALAICMVVLIHASGPAFAAFAPGQGGWWWALLWSGPARMAVPLFLMCSGALLLGRGVSPRRLLTHNLPRIAVAMFFWALVYRLAGLWAGEGLSPAGVWDALKRTVLLQHEFHFYYLHILFVVYAFLPALAVFLRSASRREEEYLLGIWWVVGVLCPVLPAFWPFSLVSPIRDWWTLGLCFTSVGYALLGHYLRTYGHTLSRRRYALSLLLGVLFTVGLCALRSLGSGQLQELFLSGNTPGPFLMAFGLFGLCLTQKTWPKARIPVAGRVARASFCIYLTHLLFQRLLAHFGLSGAMAPQALAIPGAALGMLGGSYLLWEVLRRIPVCKKYLV